MDNEATLEELLKKRREEKNLSIEDVVKDLKIRKDYLKAFEERIPENPDVYQLGYLRAYGKYLNVDVQSYITRLKETLSSDEKEKKEMTQSNILKVMRKPRAGVVTVGISLVGIVVSVILLMMLGKKDVEPAVIQESAKSEIVATNVASPPKEEESPLKANEMKLQTVATNNSPSFSIEKRGRYDYIVSGIGGDTNLSLGARVKTPFTITDPSTNKVIRKGIVKSGEKLFVPKDQGSIIYSSLVIKTRVPDALEVKPDFE